MRNSLLLRSCVYQEGAEHVESDEVYDGKVASTGHLFTGIIVRFRVTQFSWHARQHDLLPGFTCCASAPKHTSSILNWSYQDTKCSLKALQWLIFPLLTWRATGRPAGTSGSCCFCWSACGPPSRSSQTSERHTRWVQQHW